MEVFLAFNTKSHSASHALHELCMHFDLVKLVQHKQENPIQKNQEWVGTRVGSKNQNKTYWSKEHNLVPLFNPVLFSHKNNYLPIRIIIIYFNKSKLSKYIFIPLNQSMFTREMDNITFWHRKIEEKKLSAANNILNLCIIVWFISQYILYWLIVNIT